MPLVAVAGDEIYPPGGGALAPAHSSVKINNLPVAVEGDPASSDANGHPGGPGQPTSVKKGGSSKTVFAYGQPIHRKDDPRDCGDTTKVTHQSTVNAG
jgi:uncharacterized Zn-binding protein involved in type VI secretion